MRSLCLSACCLAVAGCNLAPPHVRPALPTAATYPDAFPSEGMAARATDIGWREIFADPRLVALVEQALNNNRNLVIAVAQIEEARGLYRIENSARLPLLAATGDASRTRTGAGGATFPGAPTIEQNRFTVGVGVTAFELDFWGRVRNLSEAARSEYLATVSAQRAFRLSLIRDTATNHFAILEANERIALAEATLLSRREGLAIARLRLDAGVTSALDYRQAETLLTQAETELATLMLTRAQRENFLKVLIGGQISKELPNPSPLTAQISSSAFGPGLPSELLTARPDIIAAEERLRGSRANIGVARAAFLPNISLTSSFGYASTSLDSLFDEDAVGWSFGPSFNLPLFDFGARRAGVTVAEARGDIAIARYELAIQGAFREVADALAGRRWLAEQIDAQQRGTRASAQIVELARSRYREGVASYLEVLDAERSLFAAEQALVVLRRQQADNLVTLYVALGGGCRADANDGRCAAPVR